MGNNDDTVTCGRHVVPAALRNTRHKRRKIILGVLVALLIIMSLTCPGAAEHKEAVSHEIREMTADVTEDDNPLGMFGKMVVSEMATLAVNRILDVEDYFFFSIGTIHYGDSSHTVSFGIFNHVFTFDAEYIGQSMDEE